MHNNNLPQKGPEKHVFSGLFVAIPSLSLKRLGLNLGLFPMQSYPAKMLLRGLGLNLGLFPMQSYPAKMLLRGLGLNPGLFPMQSYPVKMLLRGLGLHLAICRLQSYEIKHCTRQCRTRRAKLECLVLGARLYYDAFHSGHRTGRLHAKAPVLLRKYGKKKCRTGAVSSDISVLLA